MNPITGQVNNIIDATQRNYNTQLIPLKSDRSSKGQKQLLDQLQNFKDVQVGHRTDQQIMKEKAQNLRHTSGKPLADLLR